MSTPPSPPPSLSPQRILATVWLAVFSSSLFFRAVDPIIPQIAADLSEPAETVALLATAFALPYALMQPALGAMGDVLGKTRTMFACLVIVTIATFAGAFAWNLPILMASRVASGIVAGGIFPISLALVAQIVPIKGRQVAVSRLLAGGMLGNLLGSSASGVIADLKIFSETRWGRELVDRKVESRVRSSGFKGNMPIELVERCLEVLHQLRRHVEARQREKLGVKLASARELPGGAQLEQPHGLRGQHVGDARDPAHGAGAQTFERPVVAADEHIQAGAQVHELGDPPRVS